MMAQCVWERVECTFLVIRPKLWTPRVGTFQLNLPEHSLWSDQNLYYVHIRLRQSTLPVTIRCTVFSTISPILIDSLFRPEQTKDSLLISFPSHYSNYMDFIILIVATIKFRLSSFV